MAKLSIRDAFEALNRNSLTTGTNGDELLSGSGGDDWLIGGAGRDTLLGGAGDDVLLGDALWSFDRSVRKLAKRKDPAEFADFLDGGEGSDVVKGGRGDDTLRYTMAENAGARDIYAGGTGVDTLLLAFTAQEWARADVQADIAAYLAFLEAHVDEETGQAGRGTFVFSAFGLKARKFEALKVTVDGVEVDPTAPPLVAADDFFTVSGDAGATAFASVLNNDSLIAPVASVALLTGASAGGLTFREETNGAPDGSFIFDPGADFAHLAAGEIRDVTFRYEVTASHGGKDQALATIRVTGVNDAPTLAAGAAAVVEDGDTVSIDLSTLGADVDSDDDGASLTYAVVAGPDEGAASLSGTVLTFDPGADFQALNHGETRDVAVQVSATDRHGATALNDVTITVTGVNDAPGFADQAVSVNEGGTLLLDLTEIGSDPDAEDDGGSLTYFLPGSAGSNVSITGGQLRFATEGLFDHLAAGETFTSDITIQVQDSHSAQVEGTVEVTITGVNDAPVVENLDLGKLSTSDSPAVFDLSDLVAVTDPDSDAHTFSNVTATDASGAVVTVSDLGGGQFRIDPNQLNTLEDGESSIVTIRYDVSDGIDTSAGEATLEIAAPEAPEILMFGLTVSGLSAGHGLPWSVSSAGDFNGDGFDDVIIGASSEAPDGVANVGETHVIFGRAEGDFASPNLQLGTDSFVIFGESSGDNSGVTVSSAGDINGDGIDDIIIGAYGATADGNPIAGKSYVVFGKTGPFGASMNLSDLDGSNGFVLNGSEAADLSGFSVSGAGDVNGDGIDDVIIGSLGNASRSYVVFGKSSGFSAEFDLSALDGSNGFVFSPEDLGSNSGYSVSAAGDINGDGLDDVVIGAIFADPDGKTGAGETYVVFGTSAGFPASVNSASLDGSNGFVVKGANAYDESGVSVSDAGDVNGDGIDDIIIGAVSAAPGGNGDAGQSYVVFGSSDGFGASVDLSGLDGQNGFALNGNAASDFSGYSVSSAGDVNGDGIDDLLVGAYGADPTNRSLASPFASAATNAGQTYLVYGKDAGTEPFSALLDLTSLDGSDGFIFNGINAFDETGVAVSAAGDVNGDGFDDILIVAGRTRDFTGGVRDEGEAYLIFGGQDRLDGLALVDLIDYEQLLLSNLDVDPAPFT